MEKIRPRLGFPAGFARRTVVTWRVLALLLLLWQGTFPTSGHGAEPSVAVLYPDLGDPYRKIFLEIIGGIEAELGGPVKPYLLGADHTPAALAGRMKLEGVKVAIALGRAGYAAAKTLAGEFPMVIGAVLVSPDDARQGLSGISLNPDPQILFARLRDLVPGVKNVCVVYDPKHRGDIELARAAAQAQGLRLEALPAVDLRQSAAVYRQLMGEAEGKSVTIWLSQDHVTMDDQAILPTVLREAWDKSVVVFSSSLDHVRKGALFSLYPDNAGLGRSLAAMARDRARVKPDQVATIEPLRDVLVAVNLRTAEHLGLSFDGAAMRRFGMTFPPLR